MAGTAFSDQQVQLSHFRLRIWFCIIVILAMLGILASRFYFLQVIQHDHYHTLAENNRMSIVPVVPNRGLILDRAGLVMANNFSAYTLEINPSKVDGLDETIDRLSAFVDITPRDRKRFKKLPGQAEAHISATTNVRTLQTWLDNVLDAKTLAEVGIPTD